MSTQRFTPEFKEEAVKQVVDRGYGVPDVAARLGVSPTRTPSRWLRRWNGTLKIVPDDADARIKAADLRAYTAYAAFLRRAASPDDAAAVACRRYPWRMLIEDKVTAPGGFFVRHHDHSHYGLTTVGRTRARTSSYRAI